MNFFAHHILSVVLFTPLVGALLLLFIPRENEQAHKIAGNIFGALGFQHENAFMRLAELSAREREVLALVARGLTTAAIGQKLVISPETARTHIQNILGKLELHSRLEAATFVIENGLLDHLTVTPATRTPATA